MHFFPDRFQLENVIQFTELFINALMQPIRLVCSGLLATRMSKVCRRSSSAGSPCSSTNLNTKLCGTTIGDDKIEKNEHKLCIPVSRSSKRCSQCIQ